MLPVYCFLQHKAHTGLGCKEDCFTKMRWTRKKIAGSWWIGELKKFWCHLKIYWSNATWFLFLSSISSVCLCSLSLVSPKNPWVLYAWNWGEGSSLGQVLKSLQVWLKNDKYRPEKRRSGSPAEATGKLTWTRDMMFVFQTSGFHQEIAVALHLYVHVRVHVCVLVCICLLSCVNGHTRSPRTTEMTSKNNRICFSREITIMSVCHSAYKPSEIKCGTIMVLNQSVMFHRLISESKYMLSVTEFALTPAWCSVRFHPAAGEMN